jgi:hypothetical protein
MKPLSFYISAVLLAPLALVGCAGLIKVVVPYDWLRDVLRPGGPLSTLAAAR